MKILTQEIVKTLFEYDKDSGKIFWKERDLSLFKTVSSWKQWNKRYSGKEAGFKNKQGYITIRIFKTKLYMAHRLIWLYCYGKLPDKFIDHINGNPSDNRIKNLREASYADNSRNRHMSNGKIPFKGVALSDPRCLKKYRGYVFLNNKQIHLGTFDTPEEAHAAYCKAAKELHGEFWNPGEYHIDPDGDHAQQHRWVRENYR